jgi:hypothetical protein
MGNYKQKKRVVDPVEQFLQNLEVEQKEGNKRKKRRENKKRYKYKKDYDDYWE